LESLPSEVPSCWLIAAIRDIASFALVIESDRPSSALLRSPWMLAVIEWSCWVSTCPVDSTLLRAEVDSGLVDNACSAAVKLL
jgi:hypothetical protein